MALLLPLVCSRSHADLNIVDLKMIQRTTNHDFSAAMSAIRNPGILLDLIKYMSPALKILDK